MSIVLDGSNLSTVGVINSKTAVASTSGTSIDFTSIPAGVKRITVMFSGVSSNGSAAKIIQLGAGSITTTGYVSAASGGSGGVSSGTSTSGLLVENGTAAGEASYITAVLTNVSGNTWLMSSCGSQDLGAFRVGGGNITLGGTLDRLRIQASNGTDTFDAGTINVFYE